MVPKFVEKLTHEFEKSWLKEFGILGQRSYLKLNLKTGFNIACMLELEKPDHVALNQMVQYSLCLYLLKLWKYNKNSALKLTFA